MYLYKNIPPLNKRKYKRRLSAKKDRSPLGAVLDFIGLREVYSRPVMVQCETVNICTNDCIICAYGRMTRKKATMPMELFEKVLSDYSALGGGYLSLTPKMGDIFCDSLLPRRLEAVKKYPAVRALSVTTNALLADRYDDDELRQILAGFERIQVSIYGMDEEEYRLMTRRDEYARMIRNVGRMLRLAARDRTAIVFGFRFLKPRSDGEIKKWISGNFGRDVPYGYTLTYMDWNGALDDKVPLPHQARWKERVVNSGHCIMPLVACVIFSSGDVTLCLCNDFDAREEFRLGNVGQQSLLQLLNSPKVKGFWAGDPASAGPCMYCTSHRSMAQFEKYEFAFERPLIFIGA